MATRNLAAAAFACRGMLLAGCMRSPEKEARMETITFMSLDGVEMTGDLYPAARAEAPLIILCHMADSSRGEYRAIAPKLVMLGFSCLAIDQRSGFAEGDVPNMTMEDARKKGKGLSYADAYIDVESAIAYAKSAYKPSALILWGSSYSSDHVLVAAARLPEDVDAVLSFSPGGYSQYGQSSLTDFCPKLRCPVFITQAAFETPRSRSYFNLIPDEGKVLFAPENGQGEHGSPALWDSCDAKDEYWKAVKAFLSRFAR